MFGKFESQQLTKEIILLAIFKEQCRFTLSLRCYLGTIFQSLKGKRKAITFSSTRLPTGERSTQSMEPEAMAFLNAVPSSYILENKDNLPNTTCKVVTSEVNVST